MWSPHPYSVNPSTTTVLSNNPPENQEHKHNKTPDNPKTGPEKIITSSHKVFRTLYFIKDNDKKVQTFPWEAKKKKMRVQEITSIYFSAFI